MNNEATEATGPVSKPHNKRLWALIAISALGFAVYGFVQLDRSVAERMGPVAEGFHDLLKPVPGRKPPLSPVGRRFLEEVKALHAEPGVSVIRQGYFGTFGQEEWYNVSAHEATFDDDALKSLAELHGGRIMGLYLQDTGVTDEGLRHLKKMTMLRHLRIENIRPRLKPGEVPKPPTVTDAGMAHLKGLDHLWSLSLTHLPITDAGLEAIEDLPELNSLYLGGTRVQGAGLAKIKSLPRWSILYLDGTPMIEASLKSLAGATSLDILCLARVHLGKSALPALRAIPNLKRLEITGCGFLDEEVDALKKSRPGLRVERK